MQAMGLVFISAKSEDYAYARAIHDFLDSRGVPVFFSPSSLAQMGQADYRRAIDQALDEAEHMIVVCSSRENVTSSWVEAEWGMFINERRSLRKTGNLVTVVAEGMTIFDLPISLRQYEVIPFNLDDFPRLLPYVGYVEPKPVPPPLAEGEEPEAATPQPVGDVDPTPPVIATLEPHPKEDLLTWFSMHRLGVMGVAGVLILVMLGVLALLLPNGWGSKTTPTSPVETATIPPIQTSAIPLAAVEPTFAPTLDPDELDKEITIDNVDRIKALRVLETGSNYASTLTISPLGSFLAVANPYQVMVWQTDDWQEQVVKEFTNNIHFHPIAFTPEDAFLALHQSPGKIELWDTADWTLTRTITDGVPNYLISLGIDGQGEWIAARDLESATYLWGMDDGMLIKKAPGGLGSLTGDYAEMAISPDGKYLVVDDGTALRLMNAADLSVEMEINIEGGIEALHFSPDGTLISGIMDDGSITFWQTDGLNQMARLAGNSFCANEISFSPDGNLLASAGCDHRIGIWQINPPTALTFFEVETDVKDVVFSPDGGWLAAALADGTVGVWGLPALTGE